MTNLCILQDYKLNSVFNHFSLAKKVRRGYLKKHIKIVILYLFMNGVFEITEG